MTATTVVISPNWLGDAVMALPALAAIRAGRPGDRLVVAGRASTVPLFGMVEGVDEAARLDSRGGLVGAISWAEDAAALRAVGAQLAILLPNSFRSAWTAQRAGIGERWGYATDLRGRLLTRAAARLRGRYHQAEYYLHLVEALGFSGRVASPTRPAGSASALCHERGSVVPEQAVSLPTLPQIHPPAEALARAAELLRGLGVGDDRPLIGLAPGAAYGKAKQWPPDYYAALVVELHRRLGAVSLVFGARADAKGSGIISRSAARELQQRHRGTPAAASPAVIDLAGKTDLPLLVALMTRCRAVVSNDSGAMHVAAAAGLPVTAVFGASDERGTAPLACSARAAAPHEILTCPVWCRPCMLRECPIDHRCMRGVEPGRVADAVERQLRAGESVASDQ